jgi:hypothetical protein
MPYEVVTPGMPSYRALHLISPDNHEVCFVDDCGYTKSMQTESSKTIDWEFHDMLVKQ